jgi:thiol-disulfide isomerase/thioredoxin
VRLLVLLLLVACASAPAEPVKLTKHELPAWAALPLPATAKAKPVPWVPDGRPTLMLFTASWCPTCPASILTDVSLAQAYGDKFQVGIALVENSDEDFMASTMAMLFGDVPVWTAKSVAEMQAKCGAAEIPIACVVDRGRVVFRGAGVTARHVLDAYAQKRSIEEAADIIGARGLAIARLTMGVTDLEDIREIVKLTARDPGWQNSMAYTLAANREATPTDLALAVELAQSVVASEGGLDYTHLDNYALALSKANLPEHAAAVCWRVLALCKTVHSECMIEKRRAYAYIYYAKETGLQWRPQ